MSTHANMVKVTAASPGTGSVTVSTAVSGFRTFAQGFNSADATVAGVRIQDASDATIWEIDENCSYTYSTNLLTRGTRKDSSTGSAVNFTGSVIVSVIATAGFGNDVENVKQTYIRGLIVTKNSGGNTLDISAGACYDPSSNKIISYSGATGVSAGTLGASQWNQVYIYDSAGTATIEVKNNEAPPSATYAGTARKGGTNSNRRWIGSFLTNGSSNIIASTMTETTANQFTVTYIGVDNPAAPFRVLSAGTSATFASVSLVGVVPRYVGSGIVIVATVTLYAGAAAVSISTDGTNINVGNINTPPGTYFLTSITQCPIEPTTPQIYYKVDTASAATYFDCSTYTAAR